MLRGENLDRHGSLHPNLVEQPDETGEVETARAGQPAAQRGVFEQGADHFLVGELNCQPNGFTNNSTTPCVVNETVSGREGGAGAHPHIVAGTGDWIVN